jgi:hypothetical protein
VRIDLRYAALSEEVERRVRLAATALAAHQIRAMASDWDGTRCDLLISDSSDGYGRHIIEVAKRKRIGVLAFGREADSVADGVTWLSPRSDVAALANAIRDALVARRAAADSGRSPVEDALGASREGSDEQQVDITGFPDTSADQSAGAALVRLSTDTGLANADLQATVQGRTVQLLPSTGRVVALSFSDLLSVRDHLCEDGWVFEPISARCPLFSSIGASASLDTFYLYGAIRGKSQLPPSPSVRYGLRDWPDLGAAPDLTDALRVVRILQRGNVSPSEIASMSKLPESDVSACLWAFEAAGLLIRSGVESIPPVVRPIEPARQRTGLLGRLAAHFGMKLA